MYLLTLEQMVAVAKGENIGVPLEQCFAAAPLYAVVKVYGLDAEEVGRLEDAIAERVIPISEGIAHTFSSLKLDQSEQGDDISLFYKATKIEAELLDVPNAA